MRWSTSIKMEISPLSESIKQLYMDHKTIKTTGYTAWLLLKLLINDGWIFVSIRSWSSASKKKNHTFHCTVQVQNQNQCQYLP